jgi:hypothetical protein
MQRRAVPVDLIHSIVMRGLDPRIRRLCYAMEQSLRID